MEDGYKKELKDVEKMMIFKEINIREEGLRYYFRIDFKNLEERKIGFIEFLKKISHLLMNS